VRIGGALLLILALATVAFVVVQGRRTPTDRPYYVALGSSFAAGAGLGRLQAGSPLLCARSVDGYPQQLARAQRWPIVDMSCGGAVTRHLLHGGQFFQGPQMRTITPATRLVTITVGGNDVGYVADLSLLAARHTNTLFGRAVRLLWSGPRAMAARRFDRLHDELSATLSAGHARAPAAIVVVATYPAILPRRGTCATVGLSEDEAATMRQVADRLAAVTAEVAAAKGARLVDMNRLGNGHDACAADPWTRGWSNGGVAPFHPTLAGARATAAAIAAAVARGA
jgi:lysophospholipase L1-like esterase